MAGFMGSFVLRLQRTRMKSKSLVFPKQAISHLPVEISFEVYHLHSALKLENKEDFDIQPKLLQSLMNCPDQELLNLLKTFNMEDAKFPLAPAEEPLPFNLDLIKAQLKPEAIRRLDHNHEILSSLKSMYHSVRGRFSH
jgi:hypothetical protein